MGLQELHIQDFRPCLSRTSIQKIAEEAASRLNVWNEDYRQEEIRCTNGYVFEIHAEYVGFNYRRIRITNTQVNLFDVEKQTYQSDEECESYCNSICEVIDDLITELNDKEEEYFMETQKEYFS